MPISKGIPDYWVASGFFCPVIDHILFDTVFVLVCSITLSRRKDK
jgi:hypothetical protein